MMHSCITQCTYWTPLPSEVLYQFRGLSGEFLTELGRRMTAISCDPRETAHLFQRLSICSQRLIMPSPSKEHSPNPLWLWIADSVLQNNINSNNFHRTSYRALCNCLHVTFSNKDVYNISYNTKQKTNVFDTIQHKCI